MKIKKANVIFEYAIVLGIMAMAMVGMNEELRRAIAAKVKDLSDFFIGTRSLPVEQGGAKDFDIVRKIDSANSNKKEQFGGGTRSAINTDNRFGHWSLPDSDVPSSVRDIVDYAIKPVEADYPITEYYDWENKWPVIPAN